MKTSIDFLPEEKKEELLSLVECIKEKVPEAKFIILYGSYARNEFVDYDQRVDYGLRTIYQSDYDIIVLTPKRKSGHMSIMRRLNDARRKFNEGHHFSTIPPISFVHEKIDEFNKGIDQGRYYFTDIAKQGIILYDSGQYTINEPRELNFNEILNLSIEYYTIKYKRAESFLKGAKFYYRDTDYEMSSFMLHQATENYILSIILSASLYSPKQHNLIQLFELSATFTDKVYSAFKLNFGFESENEEDEKLLKLLDDAYTQARYSKDFVVTKEEIDGLLLRIEKLRVDAEEVSLSYIEEHKSRVKSN